jgi:hypothetical protein
MSERWFAYSHLISQLSANTGDRSGEVSLFRDTVCREVLYTLREHESKLKLAPADFYHLVKSCWASFHWLWVFLQTFYSLLTGSYIVSSFSCLPATATAYNLPGPDKHSRPHLPKTTAIFEDYTATYQKFCQCIIFQSTTTIINQNLMFGEGFCYFLLLLSIFGFNIKTNFRN